jgi:hypothetical protein
LLDTGHWERIWQRWRWTGDHPASHTNVLAHNAPIHHQQQLRASSCQGSTLTC